MSPNEILIWNLKEVRRRSVNVWRSIPPERLRWKPDAEAMTCIELVRHAPECEYLYLYILKHDRRPARGEDASLWTTRPYKSVEAEIEFAEPFRRELLHLVDSYTPEQISARMVDWSATGHTVRSVGDFILRIAYHEAVHTGQLLGYLRMMNAPRPSLWD